MSITEPSIGAQYKLDAQIYEIISINDNIIAMCSLVHKYRRFIQCDDFATMEQQGKLTLHLRAAVDICPATRLISMSDAKRQRIRVHQAYVDACLDELGGRLPMKDAALLIKRVASTLGDDQPPGVSSLWRWKKRYLNSNQNPLSLARQQPPGQHKRMPSQTEDLIRHYIDTVYLKRERPSLTHAYKLLCGQILVENKERVRCGGNPQQKPSYATFRRRILAMDSYFVTEKREGPRIARRLNKSTGHLYIDSDPYACTAFDSHDLNVIVRDEATGLVGRALLSAHIVPATRENSGWDISLGAPCAEKMLRATFDAILKNGKMACIIGDRGKEILNTWSITFFFTLGINPDYVPPGQPDAKAIIERFFGTVSTGFSNNLPGTTKCSPEARADYCSEERACLTLNQLRMAYAMWLETYHNTWHDELWCSPAQKKQQLIATALPAERYTAEELRKLCISRWTSKLDGGRIRREKLSWHGDGIPEVRQKLKKDQKAIVFFNPCDLGEVWVAHPDTPDSRHPAVADDPDYQNGLALSDHRLIVAQMRAEKRAFDPSTALTALYELNEFINECKNKSKHDKWKINKATKGDKSAPHIAEAAQLLLTAHEYDLTLDDTDFETVTIGLGGVIDDSGNDNQA